MTIRDATFLAVGFFASLLCILAINFFRPIHYVTADESEVIDSFRKFLGNAHEKKNISISVVSNVITITQKAQPVETPP